MTGTPGQYNDQQIAQLTATAQQLQYQAQPGLYGANNAQMIKVVSCSIKTSLCCFTFNIVIVLLSCCP